MPVRCGGSCPRLPAIGAQISLVPSRERIGETNRIFVGIVGIVGKTMFSLGIHCDFALPTFARDAHVFMPLVVKRTRPFLSRLRVFTFAGNAQAHVDRPLTVRAAVRSALGESTTRQFTA